MQIKKGQTTEAEMDRLLGSMTNNGVAAKPATAPASPQPVLEPGTRVWKFTEADELDAIIKNDRVVDWKLKHVVPPSTQPATIQLHP